MKANQKFISGEDEAVSPVIAVILMVAITVVLAATVYVWVSGFGAQSSTPARSIALTSAGPLTTYKQYTVASATSGMKYGDISITVNGINYPLDVAGGSSCTTPTITSGDFLPCTGSQKDASTAIINAGDSIFLPSVSAGQTLRVLDTNANSVMLTLTIG